MLPQASICIASGLVFIVSFLVAFFSVPILIKKFKKAGITGKDIHKLGKPDTPEMGGLSIVAGLVSGVLCAVALSTLTSSYIFNYSFIIFSDLTALYAALTTILIIAIIGIFDDLVSLRHSIKTLLPIFASVPLVAIAAGDPYVSIPFLGSFYLPIIYPLILIPIGVTVMANLTNMFAGFNGMEAGLGLMVSLGLLPIALKSGSMEAIVLLLGLSGALTAFLFYNKYPAKIFCGDVGTLTIGGTLAAVIILGNFEVAGVIVMIPYLIDFAIKALNGFPSRGWWGTLREGKLYCDGKPVGFAQTVMKKAGGISEKRLVLTFALIELPFILLALAIYLR